MADQPKPLDSTETIGRFLTATAARQPTPGGGSVTAVVGALAAAIGEMSLNYSIGKNTPPDRLPPLQAAIQAMQTSRALLLELMVRDQTVYAAVAALHREPLGAPGSEERLEAAIAQAVSVPQLIATTALGILQQCEAVADLVNSRLLSDLAVSADLAMATVRCAIYNARVNLSELADRNARQSTSDQLNGTLLQATVLIQRVSPVIWNRHAQLNPAS